MSSWKEGFAEQGQLKFGEEARAVSGWTRYSIKKLGDGVHLEKFIKKAKNQARLESGQGREWVIWVD
jgi:hypothetical protein